MTPTNGQWAEKLLSFIGLALMAAAIVYGFYKFNSINDQITLKEDQLIALEKQIAPLKKEIEFIRTAPLEKLITPKSLAILLPERKDKDGKQLFNFLLWLDLPFVRKADIKAVKYVFNHGSMLGNVKESSKSSNGFMVGYLGWGALSSVPVTVEPHEGAPFTIDFSMREELTIVNSEGSR